MEMATYFAEEDEAVEWTAYTCLKKYSVDVCGGLVSFDFLSNAREKIPLRAHMDKLQHEEKDNARVLPCMRLWHMTRSGVSSQLVGSLFFSVCNPSFGAIGRGCCSACFLRKVGWEFNLLERAQSFSWKS